jgi:ATP-dependent helicase/nuclease subunit A
MSILTKYQEDALEYKKHISLTANAGSGKTTVLSKRFVEILINEKISLGNIVAITFTEKAASELYSKIAKELDTRIENSESDKIYRLETIRRNLVSAKISTIHSFCIDILKDYAPEAGIDANFSPIDARTSEELLEQSIEEIINKKIRNEETAASLKYLLRIFGTKSTLIKKVKELFYKRKTTQKIIETIYNSDKKQIEEFFATKFKNDFALLFADTIKETISNVGKINSLIDTAKSNEIQIHVNMLLNEIRAKTDLLQQYRLLTEIKDYILTSNLTVKKRGYLSGKLYDENIEIIKDIENAFGELQQITFDENYELLNQELAKFGLTLIDFYKEVLKQYTDKKTQKAYLDFEDILLYAQKLLTNKEVQNALSEKYKYIMVDEYQDTNEIQYNIFMPILKNLQTGNLFVVGDEKQSIYMFREAEVEIFRKTKEEIEQVESKQSILELPHSFRLAPNIALFTNILFNKLFENANPIFNEVEYRNLVCAYTKEAKGEIEFLITDEEENEENQIVANRIIELVNSKNNNFSFGNIAILCRKRKDFTELETEFTKRNIPFSIVGGKGFYQQQLIYDIYNYLSFLINPSNDLALANILRAPYYSLSDVQLTEIALSEGETYFEKYKNYVKQHPLLNNHLRLLEKHIEISGKTEINNLIRAIKVETGYWTYIASKQDAEQQIANLNKIIQRSINITAQGFHSLYDFILYLKDAIENTDDEGQAEINNNTDSVKIMTIHQSKGLEFPVVVLYHTNQKGKDDSLSAKEVKIDKEYGVLAKLPFKNNFADDYVQAPIIGLYNYKAAKKNIAELKRLLYVAITRAEEHLIISLSHKKYKYQKKSFASFITEALELDIEQEELKLSDSLTYMKLQDDTYKNETVNETITIQLISNVQQQEIVKLNEEKKNETYEILLDEIYATEKNEIVSASKIALFLQCPRKYQLTYELGYFEVVKQYKDVSGRDDFNDKENLDEINIGANIGGKIIHSVMEKNIASENLTEQVSRLIEHENELQNIDDNFKQNLKDDILILLNHFYTTEVFQELKSYPKYENELEIYISKNDYYLYGIIDKLIIDEDRIIIVDYKTDKLDSKNFDIKKESYFNQLLFYAYLLKDNYPEAKEFELWLVFVRGDNNKNVKVVSKKEIEEFGNIINQCVQDIRNKKFDKKTKGCEHCQYLLLDECRS